MVFEYSLNISEARTHNKDMTPPNMPGEFSNSRIRGYYDITMHVFVHVLIYIYI